MPIYFTLHLKYVIVVHQNEAAIYVCELCQQQGKAVRMMQLTEIDEAETPLSDVEFQNLQLDTPYSSQMPWKDGKVCCPYYSGNFCSLLSVKLSSS